jgi:hypothetical protein
MIDAAKYLPKTDEDCDERLVKVAALYVLERGMPMHIAITIIREGIKEQHIVQDRINQLMLYISNGISPI